MNSRSLNHFLGILQAASNGGQRKRTHLFRSYPLLNCRSRLAHGEHCPTLNILPGLAE
jgi:hypothetical protein